MDTKPEPVATFTNEGMKAYVFVSTTEGFNVTLQDLDSGEFVSGAPSNIPTLEAAVAKAKKVVGVK